MWISVNFVNMPFLFLIVSLVISSIVTADTLLFILDSSITSTHPRTMTCYLHVYTCGIPYQIPTFEFAVPFISVSVHNMHIRQAAVAKYMTSWSHVLWNCRLRCHPYSPIKIKIYCSSVSWLPWCLDSRLWAQKRSPNIRHIETVWDSTNSWLDRWKDQESRMIIIFGLLAG